MEKAGKLLLWGKNHLGVLLLLITAAAGGIALLLHGGITAEEILSYTPESPWLAALVFWGLFALKGLCPFLVYDILVIAAGRLFAFPFAIFVNIVGTCITVTVPYWMGRLSKTDNTEALIRKYPKLGAFAEGGNPFFLCFLLRVMGMQNEVLGLFFGTVRLAYPLYVIAGVFGMLPGMVSFTALGDALDWREPLFWIPLVISLCMIGTAFLILRIINKKKHQ